MSNYSQKVYGRDYVQVSSDAFARTSLVRRIVRVESFCSKDTCVWCGNRNRYGSLFEYGTWDWRIDWHKGYFCSKQCHDTFHS